ncbi:zinc ribbon domain-containing protein [Candidatus Methanoprimaticola sp. MG2]|uniref:zinc ribbon domain-containing protein n=1 Tax=Candidatus Methanoprimaticola sp. MG2 TaxID=3228838 RepID=UPI0039C5B2AB
MTRVSNIFGLLFLILFGIIWVAITLSIPSPIGILFSAFGVLFIVYAAVHMVYGLRKGPVQSPPEARFPERKADEVPPDNDGFCPYCGSPVNDDYEFCRVCGKRVQ